MECPHVATCAKITSPPIINAKNNSSTPQVEWSCSACKTKKSPWICLYCGVVNCGRYVKGHAKAHYEQHEKDEHVVCMDCNSYAAYCYACDDFIVNDTKSLTTLREKLQALNNNSVEVHSRSKKRRNSSGESLENKAKRKCSKSGENRSFCKARIAGLRNLGNTCFMNAVLQSLSNIQQFSCYFKQLPSLEKKAHRNGRKKVPSKKCQTDVLLAEELRKTLISLWEGSKTAISPESIFAVIWKVVPRFRGYQQQDAHEFLRYMLDRLHTELLNILPSVASNSTLVNGLQGKSTIVTTIFGGILQNEVTCLICGNESKKHDPFLDLSLDIPQDFVNSSGKNSKSKDAKNESQSCHLQDCLSSFTQLEELAETELYYCHICRRKQKSTKRFWVRRLPNVLCLHLKRFRWNNVFRTKLDNYVHFPVSGLDMSRFVLTKMHETRGNSTGSPLYDLAAVIVHHGSGVGSGHYTAYATHEGCWHHFNDSTVTVCDEETVAKCKAYILFYIRRELNLMPFSF